jgi:hypothetical protein
MKISRRGSVANQGFKEINFSDPTYQWDTQKKLLLIHQKSVKDFNSETSHDYTVSIDATEIAKILEKLADGAMKNPADLPKEIASSLRALTQLAAVAAGLIRA